MADYVVDFRGFPACPCLAEWLPVFEAELIRRHIIEHSIDIAQLIGGAKASGGTHTEGGAADIWQHDPVTVAVARQMGADASWGRTTGAFANNRHTHIVLTGCPHNGPARYQIDKVRAGFNGLVGDAPDDGPRPLSGRTWREGIAWALEQEDREMANYEAQLAAMQAELREVKVTVNTLLPIVRKLESSNAKLLEKSQGSTAREQRATQLLRRVKVLISDSATKADIERVLDEISEG